VAQSDSAKRPTVSTDALSGRNVLVLTALNAGGDPVLHRATNFRFSASGKKRRH
jgi:hypothetical protein